MARLTLTSDVKADIIDAIQKLPELWDPDSPVKNKKIIASSWDKVQKQIGLPVEKIQSHWRILKKSYIDHIKAGKPMNSDLVHKMQFMHYILSGPQKKKAKVPRSVNQPGVRTAGIKKAPRAGRMTVEMGHTSAEFFADGQRSIFVLNHDREANTPTRKPARVQTPKKATKPATARTSSKEIKVCSWIAGHLLGQESLMSGSLKQFQHDMLEMLWFHKPQLVRELVANPFAYSALDVPMEVSDALKMLRNT